VPAWSVARRAIARTAPTCSQPEPVGFVRLEFHAAHHVDDGYLVVSGLVSSGSAQRERLDRNFDRREMASCASERSGWPMVG
jgi:hypothetical protein